MEKAMGRPFEYNPLDNPQGVQPWSGESQFDYDVYKGASIENHLKLLSVKWESDYANVPLWGTATARTSWFEGEHEGELETRVSKWNYRDAMKWSATQQKFVGVIRVEQPIDALRGFNYLYLKAYETPVNGAEPRMTEFFYFVSALNSISPNATEINLNVDAWTTFFDRAPVKSITLQQGHYAHKAVPAEEFLENPLGAPVPVNTPEPELPSVRPQVSYSSLVSLTPSAPRVCVATPLSLENLGQHFSPALAEKPANAWWEGATEPHQPSSRVRNRSAVSGGSQTPTGLNVYSMAPADYDTFTNTLTTTAPHVLAEIKAVYVLPSELINEGTEFTQWGLKLKKVSPQASATKLADLNISKSLFNYTAGQSEFAKLYTGQFARINISNYSGQSASLTVEETAGSLEVFARASAMFPFLKVEAFLNGVGGSTERAYAVNPLTPMNAQDFDSKWQDFLFNIDVPVYGVFVSSADLELEKTAKTRWNKRKAIEAANDAAVGAIEADSTNALARNARDKNNADDADNLASRNALAQNALEEQNDTLEAETALETGAITASFSKEDGLRRAGTSNAVDLSKNSRDKGNDDDRVNVNNRNALAQNKLAKDNADLTANTDYTMSILTSRKNDEIAENEATFDRDSEASRLATAKTNADASANLSKSNANKMAVADKTISDDSAKLASRNGLASNLLKRDNDTNSIATALANANRRAKLDNDNSLAINVRDKANADSIDGTAVIVSNNQAALAKSNGDAMNKMQYDIDVYGNNRTKNIEDITREAHRTDAHELRDDAYAVAKINGENSQRTTQASVFFQDVFSDLNILGGTINTVYSGLSIASIAGGAMAGIATGGAVGAAAGVAMGAVSSAMGITQLFKANEVQQEVRKFQHWQTEAQAGLQGNWDPWQNASPGVPTFSHTLGSGETVTLTIPTGTNSVHRMVSEQARTRATNAASRRYSLEGDVSYELSQLRSQRASERWSVTRGVINATKDNDDSLANTVWSRARSASAAIKTANDEITNRTKSVTDTINTVENTTATTISTRTKTVTDGIVDDTRVSTLTMNTTRKDARDAVAADTLTTELANAARTKTTGDSINTDRFDMRAANREIRLDIASSNADDVFTARTMNADRTKTVSDAIAADSLATGLGINTRSKTTNDTIAGTILAMEQESNDRRYTTTVERLEKTFDAREENIGRTKTVTDAIAGDTLTTSLGINTRTKTVNDAIALRSKGAAEVSQEASRSNALLEVENTENSMRAAEVQEVSRNSGEETDTWGQRALRVSVERVSEADARVAEMLFRKKGYMVPNIIVEPAEGAESVELGLMSSFTYWRASDAWVDTSTVADIIAIQIKGMFLNGVTFWNNPDEIRAVRVMENR